VGCKIPEAAVLPQFNELNPEHVKYSDQSNYDANGIYTNGVGFHNLKMAFGHDEYIYRFCLHNKSKIPEEGLYMLRFHSCYLWHTAKEYTQFETPTDTKMCELVKEFQSFDLYTKHDVELDVVALKSYYQKIIEKYFENNVLEW
jgi:inositol oxygenase